MARLQRVLCREQQTPRGKDRLNGDGKTDGPLMSNQEKPSPPTAEEIAAVMAIFREKDHKRKEFADHYGNMRPPMVIQVGDDVYTAIEGGIYRGKRDGSTTFMRVIHDHALMFFGVPCLEAEELLLMEQRHPALQWMYAWVEHHNQIEKDDQTKDQLGFAGAWFRFAYDLFTIRDNAKLKSKMKQRLLSKQYFQGARHELRVAAISITAGFSIEFEDEQDNKIGHAEFVATDRTGTKIAVEAKSRHRYGVQGFAGGKRLEPGSTADVRGIILDAYKKKTALPLYVFVDANLPSPTSQEHLYDWWREISRHNERFGKRRLLQLLPCECAIYLQRSIALYRWKADCK